MSAQEATPTAIRLIRVGLTRQTRNITERDREVASAIACARRLKPPMKRFAYELKTSLAMSSLSRQTVYEWESGRARVPGVVLVAAARVCGLSVDELIRRGSKRSAANLSDRG